MKLSFVVALPQVDRTRQSDCTLTLVDSAPTSTAAVLWSQLPADMVIDTTMVGLRSSNNDCVISTRLHAAETPGSTEPTYFGKV